MERKNKLIIGITVIAVIGILALIWGVFLAGPNLAEGDKTILVLAVDESESRPGMGAVDMAFIIDLKNGSISKYTPVYPGGMRHPSQDAPQAVQAQGAGLKLLLHDSLWDENTEQGMQWAKEIVEANTKFTPDAVVAINTEGLDAVIKAANLPTELGAADIIRENDELHGGGMSRGNAVISLASDLSKAANDGTKRNAMIQAALDQYSKGNIVMIPEGSFMGLMASKGLGSLL